MTAPTPYLKYLFWGSGHHSGEGIVSTDGPPLATVIEVSAGDYGGSVELHVRGPMLRRDGTPSRVQRSARVLTSHRQPDWLEEIIEDAIERLLGGPRELAQVGSGGA